MLQTNASAVRSLDSEGGQILNAFCCRSTLAVFTHVARDHRARPQ
jgi:hypothetical protein